MTIEMIDFDDLPGDEIVQEEKLVNVTVKVSENVRDMFAKIAHRERRNMSGLGSIVVEDYVKQYIADYQKKKTEG